MNVQDEHELDGQIAEWRAYLNRRRELNDTDGEELEDHLRGQIADLMASGLHADESFLIAVKRMGSVDQLSREFAREHSDRLWKQLVVAEEPGIAGTPRARRDLVIMVVCALAAIVAIKIPAAFGIDWSDDDDVAFYLRNLSLFALVPLAGFFAWSRRLHAGVIAAVAGLFAIGALGANAYSLTVDSQSLVLTAIHLPLALWLVMGVAYAGGDWRSDRKRMDFIRFTGEWFIYFVLIGLGGGVLTAFTIGVFDAIGVDATTFVQSWLLPCGGVAAVIVAAWLVEAKQSVIENMAPVLTRVFTPIFAVALLAFLAGMLLSGVGVGIDVDRDVLIIFDLLLVVVLGLLLYALSARDPAASPGVFERLQLALVVSALIIDVIVLLAITSRITEWGLTPNRSAALGENVILLVNLAWSAWLLLGAIRGRVPFANLDRWQTRYIEVYAVWAWVVVLIFPPVFDFV